MKKFIQTLILKLVFSDLDWMDCKSIRNYICLSSCFPVVFTIHNKLSSFLLRKSFSCSIRLDITPISVDQIYFTIDSINYTIIGRTISSRNSLGSIYVSSRIGYTGNVFSSNTIDSFIKKSKERRDILSKESNIIKITRDIFFTEMRRLETYSDIAEVSNSYDISIGSSIDYEDLKDFITDLNYIHSILKEKNIKFYCNILYYSKLKYDLLSDTLNLQDKLHYKIGLLDIESTKEIQNTPFRLSNNDCLEYIPNTELLISTNSG